MSGDFVNMIAAGIIDPAKVTCGALENAAMVTATEALVTDVPEAANTSPLPSDGGVSIISQ